MQWRAAHRKSAENCISNQPVIETSRLTVINFHQETTKSYHKSQYDCIIDTGPSNMPPTIHCIRHGQGLHNLKADYTLPDPPLTTLGTQQCLTLQQTSYAEQSPISLIVASPLLRTLQSALTIFNPLLTCLQTQILALPSAQETSSDACDIGSSPSVLKSLVEGNNWPVDLSLVHESWNDKAVSSRYGPGHVAITARALATRRLLREKVRELIEKGEEDPQIVLVSHGGFLHYFTGDWEDAALMPGTGWTNCESRRYVFEEGVGSEGDAEARLVETGESRRGRWKGGEMVGKERQEETKESSFRVEDRGCKGEVSAARFPPPEISETMAATVGLDDAVVPVRVLG